MADQKCAIWSATLQGIDALPVSVEVAITSGIPGFHIVGMPDTAINESRERIRAALKSSGFTMISDKVVVNLAPGSLKKTGAGFDLPIAVALLIASGQLSYEPFRHALVVGELALDGAIRSVKGTLAYELCAREMGVDYVGAKHQEAFLRLDGLTCRGYSTLTEVARGEWSVPEPYGQTESKEQLDFNQVGGQEFAKRALQIAAAGNHGVLMVGPPGSGKTMLASRLPSILPELTRDEMIATAQIYSVAGEDPSEVLQGIRPFRKPHHSATIAGLVGGGNPVRPGELSLAHNGVLFLDELAEFKPAALQSMRQPLEENFVTLVRADGALTFPSNFMLVGATNPCPCGYCGDPEIDCSCTVPQIQTYQRRIGGPLLDRIDIRLDVWRCDFDRVVHREGGTGSERLREGVLRAREYASWRRSRQQADTDADIMEVLQVNDEAERFLRDSAKVNHLSGRAIIRTINVARTIADMDESASVKPDHMGEALMFRVR